MEPVSWFGSKYSMLSDDERLDIFSDNKKNVAVLFFLPIINKIESFVTLCKKVHQ